MVAVYPFPVGPTARRGRHRQLRPPPSCCESVGPERMVTWPCLPNLPPKKTLPGRATYPRPFRSRADKVSAQSNPEATPMISTPQTARGTATGQSHRPSPEIEGNGCQDEIGNPHGQGEAGHHARAGHRDTGEVGGGLRLAILSRTYFRCRCRSCSLRPGRRSRPSRKN